MQTVNNENEIISRAKWLYASDSTRTKESCARQAINELSNHAELMSICAIFDITVDDYVKSIANKF